MLCSSMVEHIMGSQNYQTAKKVLDFSVQQHKAIASNLANIETPGYQRMTVDADFSARLKRAVEAKNLESVRDLEPKVIRDKHAGPARGDGNNVKLDEELLAMNKNALNHEFLTNYLSSSIQRMNSVIKGRVE